MWGPQAKVIKKKEKKIRKFGLENFDFSKVKKGKRKKKKEKGKTKKKGKKEESGNFFGCCRISRGRNSAIKRTRETCEGGRTAAGKIFYTRRTQQKNSEKNTKSFAL